jgi:hypothetical protein
LQYYITRLAEENDNMKVSEGVPRGRYVELYNPEMFEEHEEVIVFTRDEFSRIYTSLQEQIDYINKTDLHQDRSEEWKLIGHWPKIMEKVHVLDAGMDSMFKKEPLQCYLDAYLYDIVASSEGKVKAPESTVPVKL